MNSIRTFRQTTVFLVGTILFVLLAAGGAVGYLYATRDANPIPEDMRVA
jgi:hypothetical protein